MEIGKLLLRSKKEIKGKYSYLSSPQFHKLFFSAIYEGDRNVVGGSHRAKMCQLKIV